MQQCPLYFLFIDRVSVLSLWLVAGSCFCFSSHLLQSILLFPSWADQNQYNIYTTLHLSMWLGELLNSVPYHRSWLAVVEFRPQSIAHIKSCRGRNVPACSQQAETEFMLKVKCFFFCFCRTVPGTCLCLCHGCTPPPPSGFWTACRRCCAGPYSSPPATTQQKHLSERVSCYRGTVPTFE